MSTSTPYTKIEELIPRTSSPKVWIGFLFAVAFFIGQIVSLAPDPLLLILLGWWFYWIYCVHRIHKILAELTNYRYPIEPGRAAARHVFPVYNIVWLFCWPITLSDYLNARGRVRIISGSLIGGMLLLSMLLLFVDGAIGMTAVFGVTMYISTKVEKHVEAVTGVSPSELPSLPDPEILSRPIETTSPPQETVPRSRGRIIT